MKLKLATTVALFCIQSVAVNAGPNTSEGSGFYSQFRCADCHGDDGKNTSLKDEKTGVVTKVPLLAGMNPDDIYYKTKRFIESRSHEQVLQGCGEPPSHIQIKRISEFLATLPK